MISLVEAIKLTGRLELIYCSLIIGTGYEHWLQALVKKQAPRPPLNLSLGETKNHSYTGL